MIYKKPIVSRLEYLQQQFEDRGASGCHCEGCLDEFLTYDEIAEQAFINYKMLENEDTFESRYLKKQFIELFSNDEVKCYDNEI